jgi:hypothetical protein
MTVAQPPDTDPSTLLARHVPLLRYDSQEPYFCDSPAEWTDNPGNALRRADGSLIAVSSPASDQPELSLSFLGPQTYASNVTVSANDRIVDPARDYVAQAQAIHAKPGYANHVSGHWATGDDGRIWLAYWFFYFYNDYNLIGPLIHAGLHEGDWEMIQLRLDAAREVPDLAVYAQHRHAEARPWAQVQRQGEQPIVYSARGSHASYFTSGLHWTGAWFDHANGQRVAPPLTLHVLDDAAAEDAWATWPGTWGGTQPPPNDDNPLNDSSPKGPGGHAQYRHPDALLHNAKEHAAALSAPPAIPTAPAPTVTATTSGEDLHLAFDAGVDDPAGLVVTTHERGDPAPPSIHRIPVEDRVGQITIPGAGAGDDLTVHVSVAQTDDSASPAIQITPSNS